MRKSAQPTMSGDQTSRSSAAGAEPFDERVDEVDREDDRAGEEDGGAQPGEPLRLARPPAPLRRHEPPPGSSRLVDDLDQRGVAAGAEEDAADQVDREVDVLGHAGLRQRRADREQRAADDEGGRGDRVDNSQSLTRVYGATKVAGSGPIR